MFSRLAAALALSLPLLVGVSAPTARTRAAERFAGPQCVGEIGLTTSFGRASTVALTMRPGQLQFKDLLPDIGYIPKAVRLSLRAVPQASAKWRLLLRDQQLRLLASISPTDFPAAGGRIWTGRFNVGQVSAQLIGAGAGDFVEIEKALYYSEDAAEGGLFSTASADPNWQALSDRGQWDEARLGDDVGMMVTAMIPAVGPVESWCCSGVMLTPSLYLTNWHCGGVNAQPGMVLWDTDVRDAALIDLAWDKGSRNRQYRAREVIARSEYLDYALLRVVPTRGLGADDIPVEGARLAERAPVAGELLRLIHHPVCKPKKISLINCKAGASVPAWRSREDGTRPETDFVHGCDSEQGSSGGPIFDKSGNLLALHHLGYERDAQCNPIKRENRAVRIDAILHDIREQKPLIYEEIKAAKHGS